jgi:hypothetical protein
MIASRIPCDYVAVRRGLLEHVQEGKLSWEEFALFELLLLMAKELTGMVEKTNSTILASLFKYERHPQTVHNALNKIRTKGYIKIFYTTGRKNFFNILINKYYIAGKGFVNAEKTEDCLKIFIDRTIEIEEKVQGRPYPVMIAGPAWAVELATFYSDKIRPCPPGPVSLVIAKVECQPELLWTCTRNYLRYLETKHSPIGYRLQARNFYPNHEYLTYQDANMDRLCPPPESKESEITKILQEVKNATREQKTDQPRLVDSVSNNLDSVLDFNPAE